MARFLANLPNGKIDEEGVFRLLGTLFNRSGVLATGGLAVSAQLTPDMTVKVAGGPTGHDIVFHSPAGTGQCYHGWNTANENVTISANASGVTKTDAIVAYADLAAGIATSNNPGALKFLAIRRSGALTGAPTTGDITGTVAIGSKPYVVLAYVTVANGAGSINSGNISDQRPIAQLDSFYLSSLGRSKLAVGALPEIHIPMGFVGTSSPTYTTIDPSKHTVDFSKLMTGVTAAFFRVTANTGGAGTFTIQYYNLTDGAAIVGSEISTTSTGATEITSGDIKADLPATSKLMGFQAKQSSGGSAVWRAELVLQY